MSDERDMIASQQQPENGANGKTPIRQKLPAEKTFDTLVYGGIGTVATATISAMSAYWAKYGSGKEKCDQIAQSAGKKFSQWTGASLEKSVRVAHSWVMTTALMAGGLALLIPIKMMEDRKPHITRRIYESRSRLREARGNAFTTEENATHEQALQQLEDSPKQTWGNILVGRAVGTVGVYSAFGIAAAPIKNVSEGTARVFTDALATSHLPPLKQAGHAPGVRKFTDVLMQDVIASAIMASTLYIYTHFISPPKKHLDDAEAASPETSAPPPPASAPPTDAKPSAPDKFKPMKTYADMVSSRAPLDAAVEVAP